MVKCLTCSNELKDDTVFCNEVCFLIRKTKFDKGLI